MRVLDALARLWPLWLLGLLVPACGGGGQLLSNASVQPNAIAATAGSPNRVAHIAYTLTRDARVTVAVQDAQGHSYELRHEVARPADSYQTPFDGTYQGRVLPVGQYRYVVQAVDARGQSQRVEGAITITAAETDAPDVVSLHAAPNPFFPNGSGVADEARIEFGTTKRARVSVVVSDAKGNRWTLLPPTEKDPQLFSVPWNGKAGDRLWPDGTYTVTVEAADEAGNVTTKTTQVAVENGGVPRAAITKVVWTGADGQRSQGGETALSVPLGGELKVEMTVVNRGTATLRTLGPPSGYHYDTDRNFNSLLKAGQPLYFERRGFWRVGVEWEGGSSGRAYPARWGFGQQVPTDDAERWEGQLRPGEEATVTGYVKILQRTPELHFWAGLVQEAVGYPVDKVATQRVKVGY